MTMSFDFRRCRTGQNLGGALGPYPMRAIRGVRSSLTIVLGLFALVVSGCFQRLEVPSAEERAPSLVKAFSYASHGRSLAASDVSLLQAQLEGEQRELFDALLDHLENVCSPGDRVCGRSRFLELADLLRRFARSQPDDVKTQLSAASGLFFIGQSADHGGFGAELSGPLIAEGRARVMALLQRFPAEARVHGQLAFMKTFERGREDEIRAHIQDCLALDPQTAWCRKLARRY